MTRLNTLSVLCAVSLGVTPLTTGLAQAQASGQPTAAEQPVITVLAPRARQTGRTYSGIPVETLTAQSIVNYSDLNLRTAAGQAELKDRVAKAAKTACAWLDEVYPLSTPIGPNDCVLDAQKRANDQIEMAINQANR